MKGRAGFTMVELVFVILIGSVLTAIALSSVRNAQAGFSVQGARNAFVTVHARTRARAIELGQNAVLYMDLDGDSASVVQNGVVVETIHFRTDYNVNFFGPAGPLELCMSPRGFGDSGCSNFSTVQGVGWAFAGDTVAMRILPLGQLLF
jgi:prepilin-type N-terminal cleavage/methylation domain-containing protein